MMIPVIRKQASVFQKPSNTLEIYIWIYHNRVAQTEGNVLKSKQRIGSPRKGSENEKSKDPSLLRGCHISD
jgi:hypothetical protein